MHTDRIYLLNKAFPQVVRERFTVQMRWETIINCALKKALTSTESRFLLITTIFVYKVTY